MAFPGVDFCNGSGEIALSKVDALENQRHASALAFTVYFPTRYQPLSRPTPTALVVGLLLIVILMVTTYVTHDARVAQEVNSQQALVDRIIHQDERYNDLHTRVAAGTEVYLSGTVPAQEDLDRLNGELKTARVRFLVREVEVKRPEAEAPR